MSAHCPPQEQLERLLDDRLETIEDATLARHVESCAQCQARLEQLLSGSLSSSAPLQSNPEVADDLLIRLKKRGRRSDDTDKLPGTQPLANAPAKGVVSLPDVPGYEVLSEIGRGGMGVIYKARHLRLGRVVALKMILAGAHARSDELRRFRIEASAVARLAHPGIVGVYDVGEHEGLPYLSLELVEGGSLKQLLAGVPQPAPESARLVEQLARAVQHAHDAGIVHRDLKPANVLLATDRGTLDGTDGTDGTDKAYPSHPSHLSHSVLPKITDFGLAKLLTGGPSDGPTQSGAVVGTPGYMAPEQAAGNQRQVGPAVDVYALGAILYECLTGRPPFQAATTLETLLQVMHEEPVSISRLQPHVPRDLATIAMRCLEKQPIKRYSSASDLADDLRRFLAGQPIHARRVGPFERGWRWCKRNPVVAGLASGLLVALVLGIAGVSWKWWEADQRRQEAEASADAEKLARQDEAAQRAKAEASADAEKLARQDEAAQRAKAEKASDRTRQVLDAMVSGVTGDSLSTQKAITDEQKKFLTEVLSYYREFAGEKADDEKSRSRTAQAAYRVGTIEYRLGRKTEGAAAFRQARDGYEKLAADFPAVPQYRLELAYSLNDLGILLADLGKSQEAEQQLRQALALREKLVADFPTRPLYRHDLARSRTSLGILLAELGKGPEAEQQYRQALALQEKLATDFPAVPQDRQELARSHTGLGVLLKDLGKWPEAEPQYRQALALQEKLAADFPAEPLYRQELANNHNNLGALLFRMGKRPEAEQRYRQALALQEKLAGDFPAVPLYRQDLAVSHNNLGGLLYSLGKGLEAEQQYRQALALREKLAADFPAVPLYQTDLGASYCNFGHLVRARSQPGESLGWYEKAIRTLTAVYDQDRRLLKAKQFLRNSHWGRAQAYDRLHQYASALQDWDKSVELSPPQQQPAFRASGATARINAGQVAEAVAEVAALTQRPTWNAGQWYDFACVYAVASGKVVDKKQQYADRAMALLHKAVKAGYKDAAHMKKDTDLDALRERDDFKKLLVELAKPAEPKK